MVSGMKVPDASPATAWPTSTLARSGAKGISADASANTEAETISTRRGPNTRPSQAAIGPMHICPTVAAVVIQAPSSKPACTAPRRSASPKVVMRVNRVEITEPSSTAAIPMKGRVQGGAAGAS